MTDSAYRFIEFDPAVAEQIGLRELVVPVPAADLERFEESGYVDPVDVLVGIGGFLDESPDHDETLRPVAGALAFVASSDLIEQGDLGEAARALEAGLEVDPGNEHLLWRLALIRTESGDPHGSLECCEQILSLGDGLPRFHVRFFAAALLIDLDEHGMAKNLLEPCRAVMKDPRFASLLDRLERESSQRPCPSCGTAVSVKAVHCHECGARVFDPGKDLEEIEALLEDAFPGPVVDEINADADKEEVPAQGTAETAPATCSSCGETLSSGGRFCPACGQAVPLPEVAEPKDDDDSTAPAFCSSCGAALTPGSKFCGECGKPVERTGSGS